MTVALLRGGLIDVWQQDERLSKFIYKDPRPILLNFAASLIRECLFTEPPLASSQQFALSVEALASSIHLGRVTEE